MAKTELKTMDIKGKPYVLVNDRVKAFRENYPGYALTTNIIDITDKKVVMKAEVTDPDGRVLATGHAYEMADSTYINKTSYIENCETSAWGRALGNFGIGIDGSMCSAEEVATAIINQEKMKQDEMDSSAKAKDPSGAADEKKKPTKKTAKNSAKTPPVRNEPPVIYSTPDELDELRFLLKQYSQLSGEQVTLSQVLKDVERTADKLEKDMLDKLVSEYKEKIDGFYKVSKVTKDHVHTLISTIDRYNELTGQNITVQQVAKKQGFDKLEDFDIQTFKKCMDSFNKLITAGSQNAQQG